MRNGNRSSSHWKGRTVLVLVFVVVEESGQSRLCHIHEVRMGDRSKDRVDAKPRLLMDERPRLIHLPCSCPVPSPLCVPPTFTLWLLTDSDPQCASTPDAPSPSQSLLPTRTHQGPSKPQRRLRTTTLTTQPPRISPCFLSQPPRRTYHHGRVGTPSQSRSGVVSAPAGRLSRRSSPPEPRPPLLLHPTIAPVPGQIFISSRGLPRATRMARWMLWSWIGRGARTRSGRLKATPTPP